MAPELESLEFKTVNYPELQQLLEKTHNLAPMKYYHKLPGFFMDRRVVHEDFEYILAIKNQTIVAMIELQHNPDNKQNVWLKYITVSDTYKHQGIGKSLAEHMCLYLKDKPWKLTRSRPSDEGLMYIKSVIDKYLDKYQINVEKNYSKGYDF